MAKDLTVIEGGGPLDGFRTPKALDLPLRVKALVEPTKQANDAVNLVIFAVKQLSEDRGCEHAKRTIARQRALLVDLNGDDDFLVMNNRYAAISEALERAAAQPFEHRATTQWLKRLVGCFPVFEKDGDDYLPMLVMQLAIDKVSPVIIIDAVFQAVREFNRRPSIAQFLDLVKRRRNFWLFSLRRFVHEAFDAAVNLLNAINSNERKVSLFQALPPDAIEGVVRDIDFLKVQFRGKYGDRKLVDERLEPWVLENHGTGAVQKLIEDIVRCPLCEPVDLIYLAVWPGGDYDEHNERKLALCRALSPDEVKGLARDLDFLKVHCVYQAGGRDKELFEEVEVWAMDNHASGAASKLIENIIASIARRAGDPVDLIRLALRPDDCDDDPEG